MLAIDPNMPRGPKMHLTTIGVNFRSMSSMKYPPWVLLSQLWLHMVNKTCLEKQTNQLSLVMPCKCIVNECLLAGPIKWNRSSVTVRLVFKNLVTFNVGIIGTSKNCI